MASNVMNSKWLRPILALLRACRAAGAGRLRGWQRSPEQSATLPARPHRAPCSILASDAPWSIRIRRQRFRFPAAHLPIRLSPAIQRCFLSRKASTAAVIVLIPSEVACGYHGHHHGAGCDRLRPRPRTVTVRPAPLFNHADGGPGVARRVALTRYVPATLRLRDGAGHRSRRGGGIANRQVKIRRHHGRVRDSEQQPGAAAGIDAHGRLGRQRSRSRRYCRRL